jgi:hypothetical protein
MKLTIKLLALLLALLLTKDAFAGIEIIPTHGRNIYRVEVAELDGKSAMKEIVGSTYDNRVCAFAVDGTHLWDAPTGGFVFDLATGDLDGDGRDEIVAAAADNFVYVFTPDGKLRWKYDLGAPVYQVAVAKLDGKSPVVLATGVSRELVELSPTGKKIAAASLIGAGRMMRAGDLDGDGADEVVVMPLAGQSKDLCFFKGPKLTKMVEPISQELVMRQTKDKSEDFRKGKKTWGGQTLKTANGTVAVLDGSGAATLIYPPGGVTLKGGPHQTFALPETFAVPSYDQNYNMRLPAAGNLTDSPGGEIVLVEGATLRLYSATGKELGKATAPLGFTAVAYLPGTPYGSVILGSSPNGDDNLYRLTFEPGWEKSLQAIERRGVMQQIGSNLKAVADSTATWKGKPMKGADGPFDIMISHHMWSGWNPKTIEGWIAEVRDYEKQFPYQRLRFSVGIWPGEDAPLIRPDGKPWNRDQRLAHNVTREQIVTAAKMFEAAHAHFWVQVGHGCAPHLEVETVAAMLEAAPNSLLGFISAEDEQLGEMNYYFEHHLKPILELSLKYKKRVILRNKDVWWAQWPADPKLHEMIFNGRYRSVLLPSVEDSNSRETEVNLAARIGLWLDGQVDNWASRECADWFCASRAWEWEYVMTGHPALRYYVSQAMLGSQVFMMLNGERDKTDRWTRVGSEGTATFLNLLGKGILTPPQRDQLRAISPVAVVMEQASKRFGEHGANGHHPERWMVDGTDKTPWAFGQMDTYWAMAPVLPTDVASYLWNRTRRDSSQIPTTGPQGFVCLLPGGKPQTEGLWNSLWTTDGDTLKKDGKMYSLTAARDAITAELADGARKFPFRVEGQVFNQIIEETTNRFLIVLVDSGWLNPADQDVKITAQLPGNWLATDRLTGGKLGDLREPLSLRVPAGTFRLIEFSPAENNAAAKPQTASVGSVSAAVSP